MQLSPDVRDFLEPAPKRFADVFMNADPNHSAPVDRASRAEGLPRRRALFESAGASPLRLVDGSDEPLGDNYVLARTVWQTQLGDGAILDLPCTYILRRTSDGFEVVFYLNHQDLPAVLASHSPTTDLT